MVQAAVRRKSRLRVKGLKVRDREKIKEAMAISIQNGNYTNREIGVDIGKDLVQYRGTWQSITNTATYKIIEP